MAASDTHESGKAALPALVFGVGGAAVGVLTGLVAGLSGRRKVVVYESQ